MLCTYVLLNVELSENCSFIVIYNYDLRNAEKL